MARLREMFECNHLKFTVVGPSKQASKEASIRTHVHNTVMLVWGLVKRIIASLLSSACIVSILRYEKQCQTTVAFMPYRIS